LTSYVFDVILCILTPDTDAAAHETSGNFDRRNNAMPHRQIVPVAIGLVLYGLVRTWINGVFTSLGFPFA
jgi:hypothetical protein